MDAKQAMYARYEDIIFEGRNKAYGAYELRRKYYRHLLIGFVSASAFLILALLTPAIIDALTPDVIVTATEEEEITTATLAAPPPLDKSKPPPPPPPMQMEIPPEQMKFTPPDVKKDEEVEKDFDKTMDQLKETNVGTQDVEGPKDPPPPAPAGPPPPKDPPPAKKEVALDFAGVMPSFDYPGGFRAWLQKNLIYPEFAREQGLEGKVTLTVVIEKDGSVSEVDIHPSTVAHSTLKQAALDVVKKMPKWKPGLNQGEPVRVKQTIPVVFNLD